jgi:hypothetical protein
MIRIGELDLGLEAEGKKPRELLQRAVGSMVYRSERPKLENWILFNFCLAYNRNRTEKFEWCERRPPPEPNFRLYTQPGSRSLPLEVTELLDPGRERDREYKWAWETAESTGDYLIASELSDPPADYDDRLIEHARHLLSKKFGKDYPQETWLVVYFDPTLFTQFGEDALSYGMHILRAALNSVVTPERIRQVWLLTNELRIAQL